jgi:ribosome biogenesis GTPase
MPDLEKYHKGQQIQERKDRLKKARKGGMRPNAARRKPRQRDWEELADEEWASPGFIQDERVMPLGSQSRHKVVEAMARQSIEKASDTTAVDESDLPEGTSQALVIEAAGERCAVLLDGEEIECTVRRSLLVEETTFTSVVVAGDQAAVTRTGTGEGVVEKVLPRKTVLARRHHEGAKGLRQIMAANVDRVLVVASWRKPAVWPELIDRYLIAAARSSLEAVICINKIDLVEDPAELEEVAQPYRDAGYQVLLTSAESGVGIDALRELLGDAVTVFAGLSGVGKSSLLSQVQPGLALRALTVGERGSNRNQGRHTTTLATLYPLAQGGAVIDTPGIRGFGLAFLEKRELSAYYPEFAELLGQCAFSDCTHEHEPDCAVKAAVERGEISPLRYESYLKIRADLPG